MSRTHRSYAAIRAALALGVFAIATATVATPQTSTATGPSVQNVRGSVSINSATEQPAPLEPEATAVLADNTAVSVGLKSLAQVTFADGSIVLVASQTELHVISGASPAKLSLTKGSIRFQIQQAVGNAAPYTIQTPGGQVLVSEGVGEIYLSGSQIVVACDQQSESTATIQVVQGNGTVTNVKAGQALTATIAAGSLLSIAEATIGANLQATSNATFAVQSSATSGTGGGGGGGALVPIAAAVGVVGVGALLAHKTPPLTATPTPVVTPYPTPSPSPSPSSTPANAALDVHGCPQVPDLGRPRACRPRQGVPLLPGVKPPN